MVDNVTKKETIKNWLYINLQRFGDDPYPPATVRFSYDKALLSEQKKYDCYVERLKVPLHAIPFVDDVKEQIPSTAPSGFTDAAIYTYDNGTNSLHASATFHVVQRSFSIQDFLLKINNLSPVLEGLTFSLQPTGKIAFRFTHYDATTLVFTDEILQLLDWNTAININLVAIDVRLGGTSVLNRLDQLRRIEIICSELFTRSEIFQDRDLRIITDFIISTDYTSTFDLDGTQPSTNTPFELSHNSIRQDLLYEPNRVRKINLFGDGSIRSINLQAFWVDFLGVRRIIQLPPRTVFQVKLAFVDAETL